MVATVGCSSTVGSASSNTSSSTGASVFFFPRSSAISSRRAARLASASSCSSARYSFSSAPSNTFFASFLSLASCLVTSFCRFLTSASPASLRFFSAMGCSLAIASLMPGLACSRACSRRVTSFSASRSSLATRSALSASDSFFAFLTSRIFFSMALSLLSSTDLKRRRMVIDVPPLSDSSIKTNRSPNKSLA